jgi:hypothetical protein
MPQLKEEPQSPQDAPDGLVAVHAKHKEDDNDR